MYYPRKRPNMDIKANAQKAHFQRRVAERGVELSFREAIVAIQSGQSEFVRKQSNRVSIHKIGGVEVVYDRLRGTVVTVLPLEER